MTFIVNADEWDLNGMPTEDVEAWLEKLLQFISVSTDRGEEVLVGDDFQSRAMRGDLSLWELQSDDGLADLSAEIFQELAAWLMRNPGYANDSSWPEGLEDVNIQVGSQLFLSNFDLAWIHHSVRAKTCVACYSMRFSGSIETTSTFGTADVFFVTSEEDRLAFWRDSITTYGDNLDSLVRYSGHAFPNLHFVDGVIFDFAHLGGGYLASRTQVSSALSVLDDYASWVFSCLSDVSPPTKYYLVESEIRATNQVIIRRFKDLALDVAPEKPNVKNDRKCREAREVLIGGKTHYCEWHVKLEGHRNRIHIHPPTKETGYKPAIAIVHEHLPLP